jgi:UDP-GlcNAc:undecaprenyl-phosphate GlcNAc-1-phosphate transferase
MKTYLTILMLACAVTFFMTPVARWMAFRLGAVDLPGGRKVHTQPMARFGGLAVFAGFCAPWGGLYLMSNRVSSTFQDYERLFATLMVGALAMLILGAIDDIKSLPAGRKFLVQIGVALWLFLGGYRITTLSNPFGTPIVLGWLSLPVSLLWIVGLTNAINLLDGIDGLATGVTACIALALALINLLGGNILVALLTFSLAGACLGFLPYNFSPARIFLGDSGSLVLGMVLSCIGMLSLFKAATATFIVVPLLLFALPLYDTASVMLGRALRGAPIFGADRTHVHHRLLGFGLSHRQAAIVLYALCVVMGALAVALSVRQTDTPLLRIGTAVLALTLVTWWAWRRRHRHANPQSPPHAPLPPSPPAQGQD